MKNRIRDSVKAIDCLVSSEDGLVDLLVNIRHYCQAKGYPIREVLGDSWACWNEENGEH
jgi:hypothetical protein